MTPYEKFREALRGTPLEGIAERIRAAYDLRDGDPAWIYAGIVGAATANLDASLQRTDALADELPTRIEAVLRLQVEPLSVKMASSIGTTVVGALKDEITERLSAQHAVAMESHARAHSAVDKLEGRAMASVAKVEHEAKRWFLARDVWYPVAIVVVALALLGWNWSVPSRIAYAKGHQDGFSAGYRAGAIASFHNDAAEYLHQRPHWNARVANSEIKE